MLPFSKSERILIFNVNWLGDVLFSTAVIRNLRYNFPDAFIACIIPSRCYSVLEGNPYLNEIIIFDEKTTHRSIGDKIRFVRMLRTKRFDRVFLLHRSLTRVFLCWLAGIRVRTGYDTFRSSLLLTNKIPLVPCTSVHRIDYYLGIIKGAGLDIKDSFTDFFVSQKDTEFAAQFLKKNSISGNDFVVGINAGGNWMPKRWPPDRFAKLADTLIEKFSARVVITGGPEDTKLADTIVSAMKHKPVICCGFLSLKQFGGLSTLTHVFISADSGPLHIASASGAKNIIALFGPTDPSVTGPRSTCGVTVIFKETECAIPCYNVECSDNRCMKAITPEDVVREVEKVYTVWRQGVKVLRPRQ
ncbi:MAG: lipopolysaccharide heptosyltransferase II [Candidatus Omnitrophica bacterium]|nr:lipopolysaccharide heptosyltransferase II [Candidatus Omnitrophota bacterium]